MDRPLSPREFYLRRLHSLVGIIPLLPFLAEHFFTNSYAPRGPQVYAEKVEFLTTLPFLPLLEWGFILLPLAFHALFGAYIIFTWAPATRGPYVGHWRYILQRATAVVILAFILVHLLSWRFGPLRAAGLDRLFWAHMRYEFLHDKAFLAIYLIGFAAVSFHVANGLWTFCIRWGVIVGAKAQQRLSWLCLFIGLGLMAVQTRAVIGMMQFNTAAIPREFQYNPDYQGSMSWIFGGTLAGIIIGVIYGYITYRATRPATAAVRPAAA